MHKLLIISLIIFSCISAEDSYKNKSVELQGPGILTLKTEKNITAMAKLICLTCETNYEKNQQTKKDYCQGMGAGNGINYSITLKHDHKYCLQIEKNNIYLSTEEINTYFDNGDFNFVSDTKVLDLTDQPFYFQQSARSTCILY